MKVKDKHGIRVTDYIEFLLYISVTYVSDNT